MLKGYEIEFDERWDDKEGNRTVVWFIAPKELLDQFFKKNYFQEAVRCSLSLEFPLNEIKREFATPSISPTREYEEGYTEDYDWYDISLDDEDLEYLINMIKLREYVETNCGKIPVIDYLEIRALNFGYNLYKELYNDGLRITGYEDIEP